LTTLIIFVERAQIMKFLITYFPLTLPYNPNILMSTLFASTQIAYPYKMSTILIPCLSYTNGGGGGRHKSHPSSISTMGGGGKQKNKWLLDINFHPLRFTAVA
jgi:hypothetical protein